MADTNYYIKRVKLNDGTVCHICDDEAARALDLQNYLPLNGGKITGNLEVDGKISANLLSVVEVSIMEATPEYVLSLDSEGNIKKRSVDNLLEDIGGISYQMNETEGILSLVVGK